MSRSYGLIGCPLGHSFSPQIHSQLGNYEYKLNELSKDELPGFMKDKPLDGFNVTIPYKLEVMPYLDEITDSARRIGAVNTVAKRRDGSLIGDNTDYYGLKELLDHAGIAVKGRTVLILGTGGASLMAQTLVSDLGADKILVASRSPKGKSDISELITYEAIKSHPEIEVLINATPVGMYPNIDNIPIDLDDVPGCRGVIDIIANPVRSRLVLEAQKRGIPAEGGLRMLIAQAVKASQIFRENSSDEDMILSEDAYDLKKATDRIMDYLKRDVMNIVFVGMPGSGKTTASNLMHDLTGMPAIDTDDMIIAREGKSIPQIFDEIKEAGFRKIEKEIVKEASLKTGHIIATGGGAILSEENRRHLKNNGYVVYLDAPVDILATDGRPLSKSREALIEMRQFRQPLYEDAADVRVEISEDYKKCIEDIKDILGVFFR